MPRVIVPNTNIEIGLGIGGGFPGTVYSLGELGRDLRVPRVGSTDPVGINAHFRNRTFYWWDSVTGTAINGNATNIEVRMNSPITTNYTSSLNMRQFVFDPTAIPASLVLQTQASYGDTFLRWRGWTTGGTNRVLGTGNPISLSFTGTYIGIELWEMPFIEAEWD